jgi:thymidylate synthase (FAD)
MYSNMTRIELFEGKGFVELVDYMPREVPVGRTADIAIVRNARVSTQNGDKSIEDDTRLINYLYKHRHTSPFESVVFKFHIRLPIFVERQLIRHRTASVNEQSHRYSTANEDFYFPKLRIQDPVNRQSSYDLPCEDQRSEEWNKKWEEAQLLSKNLYAIYSDLVKDGAAREVVRTILPVSLMTELMWQMNLHNLFHFLRLRRSEEAQREIRELADAIYQLIKPIVPIACEAYDTHV